MFNLSRISIGFNDRWLLWAGLGLAVYLFLILLLYLRTNPPLSRKLRIFLGGLRFVALLSILICLAEMIFIAEYRTRKNPYVVFLTDNSSSLATVEDFEHKKKFLEQFASGQLDNLIPSGINAEHYLFSDTLYGSDRLTIEGHQTALGKSIANLADLYKDKNLVALIIASDGLSNFGVDPVEAARQIGVPIYAVDLGPQKISRDLRIVSVDHDPIVYADKPFDIEVEVEGRGFDKLDLPLVVRSSKAELARQNVTISGQGERQKYKAEITIKLIGLQNLTVSLPTQPGEELAANNSRTFTLKVLKSQKRILLAAPELNWEVTFLKRAILSSPDYLVGLCIVKKQSHLPSAPFPMTLDSLAAYDLIILVNCDNQFLSSRLGLLSDYVYERGGAVWFLLGNNSLGRLAASGNRNIYPFESNPSNKLYSDFPFHIRLTEEGKLHPVTRIVEDSKENINIWQKIPPFEEHLFLTNLKPEARVLAVHPEKEYGKAAIPLIFYYKLGKGKVLSFALGPLWKLGFLNIGSGGDAFVYKQLIANSLSWLTTQEDLERIKLAPDQPVYKSGELVRFEAAVLDENYSPLQNSVVNLTVKAAERPDSLISTLTQTAPGRFSVDLGLLAAGDYDYHGVVAWEDKILKEISGQFRVEGFSLEEETLYLPQDLMKRISLVSGGKCYTVDNFRNISSDLTATPKFRSDIKETRPSQSLWILILILVLLSVEWIIRKRSQLL